MPDLPSPQAALYLHPLPALERWLRELGAVQRGVNSCHWDLVLPQWSAEIELQVEELCVRWISAESPDAAAASVERHFPYGLSRADVEAAIMAGP